MPMTHIDERLQRGNTHVAASAKRGQDREHQLAEALADLRHWAHHHGVSFSLACEMARTAFIHDRVNLSSEHESEAHE